jgi:hypothetical protein
MLRLFTRKDDPGGGTDAAAISRCGRAWFRFEMRIAVRNRGLNRNGRPVNHTKTREHEERGKPFRFYQSSPVLQVFSLRLGCEHSGPRTARVFKQKGDQGSEELNKSENARFQRKPAGQGGIAEAADHTKTKQEQVLENGGILYSKREKTLRTLWFPSSVCRPCTPNCHTKTRGY